MVCTCNKDKMDKVEAFSENNNCLISLFEDKDLKIRTVCWQQVSANSKPFHISIFPYFIFIFNDLCMFDLEDKKRDKGKSCGLCNE